MMKDCKCEARIPDRDKKNVRKCTRCHKLKWVGGKK